MRFKGAGGQGATSSVISNEERFITDGLRPVSIVDGWRQQEQVEPSILRIPSYNLRDFILQGMRNC